MNLSPKAQRLLALQHAKYFRSLPDKKTRIDHCWNAIQRYGWTHELSACLKTEVHRLAGSAGSYGLSALGQTALDMDVLLTKDMDISNSELDISNSEFKHGPEFTELMQKLYQAMDEVITGLSKSPDQTTNPRAF